MTQIYSEETRRTTSSNILIAFRTAISLGLLPRGCFRVHSLYTLFSLLAFSGLPHHALDCWDERTAMCKSLTAGTKISGLSRKICTRSTQAPAPSGQESSQPECLHTFSIVRRATCSSSLWGRLLLHVRIKLNRIVVK